MEGYHRSVLLKEAVDALNPPPDGGGRDVWYLDLTLGDGGHSIEIIARGGKVVGVDVDPQALMRVRKRFRDLGITEDKFRLILGNFRDIRNLLSSQFENNFTAQTTEPCLLPLAKRKKLIQQMELKQKFAGAIFDLGVSSLQLEDPERGFSFAKEGPLDMRMGPDLAVRALDLLNTLTRKELYELFHKLGEEKYSWQLAHAVVRAREVKPIEITAELAEIVVRTVGGARGKHPATKVFQALRIAVNDELDALREGLNQVIDLTRKNGRIVVISFHSLEDRIVKNTFRGWKLAGIGEILTKKPVVPSGVEVAENPRSRSAKMRVFKKL